MDAGNILKPAPCSWGNSQLVGATTLNEYRIIEKDAASRASYANSVKVDEPTVEETITILKGFKRNTKTTTTFNIPMSSN